MNSDPIRSCFELAKTVGREVFAVESDNECFVHPTALYQKYTYAKYGTADPDCANGRGGHYTMNVYKIGIGTFYYVGLIFLLPKYCKF